MSQFVDQLVARANEEGLLDVAYATLDTPLGKAAVVLRFAVDLRYRDVGKALGTSEDAARQSVREALKKLRASAAELKEMTR